MLIILNGWLFSGRVKSRYLIAINFIIVYGLYVGGAMYYELKYDRELATYDLNDDGFFSGEEITPEMEAAMLRVTSDTGRTFAPFFGIIVAAFFSLIYLFEVVVYRFIRRHVSHT